MQRCTLPAPVTGPTRSNGEPTLECFAFRSGDRGRTWEAVPTRVSNPHGGGIHRDAHPLVQFPDGTLMGAMTMAMTPGARQCRGCLVGWACTARMTTD